ncbi:phage baseplate assembly protein [Insolitispirillum peregrinum]|uniref:phage baseplate assembly protein n=1 Tax=Insolitispirillum peregrinum TaxID=80876 RepID=UPI00362419C7
MPETAADLVTLRVNNTQHRGWTTVDITRSLSTISNAFSLTVANDWGSESPTLNSTLLKPGDICQVLINDQPVVTGYIDSVKPSYDAKQHQISVSGRDRTGDLVDCSADVQEWHDHSLDDIVRALIAPFSNPELGEIGIRIAPEGRTLPQVAKHSVHPGDTVYSVIERLSRQTGCLVWSDGTGGLIIGNPVKAKTGIPLQRRVNILSASASNSWSKRYRNIVVLSDSPGKTSGPTGSLPFSLSDPDIGAKDWRITRYRPLLMIAEASIGDELLEKRAEWERQHNAGQGQSYSVTVQGWLQDGQLWAPGQTVSLTDDWLGADDSYLISTVNFKHGTGGTTTTLTVIPDSALGPEPNDEVSFKDLHNPKAPEPKTS